MAGYPYREYGVVAWRRPDTPADWRDRLLTDLHRVVEHALRGVPRKAERPTGETWEYLSARLAQSPCNDAGMAEIRCGSARRVWVLWWVRGRGKNRSAGYRIVQGDQRHGTPITRRSKEFTRFHGDLRRFCRGYPSSEPAPACRVFAPGAPDNRIWGAIYGDRAESARGAAVRRRRAPLVRYGLGKFPLATEWRIIERAPGALLVEEDGETRVVLTRGRRWSMGSFKHIPLESALELIAIERIAENSR